MPDSSLIKLGVIAFCSMMCEGAMFDWSTIYFRDIVHPDKALIGAGYPLVSWARYGIKQVYLASWFAHRFGLKRILQVSESLTRQSVCLQQWLFPIWGLL